MPLLITYRVCQDESDERDINMHIVKQFVDCLAWLSDECERLKDIDQWGGNERDCVEAWTLYIRRRRGFLNEVVPEFDEYCQGLSEEKARRLMSAIKSKGGTCTTTDQLS
jgi:hypothetical protein